MEHLCSSEDCWTPTWPKGVTYFLALLYACGFCVTCYIVFISTYEFSHFYPSYSLPIPARREWSSSCVMLSLYPGLNHDISPSCCCANSNHDSTQFSRSCCARGIGFVSFSPKWWGNGLPLSSSSCIIHLWKQAGFVFSPDLFFHVPTSHFPLLLYKSTTDLSSSYYARSANTKKSLEGLTKEEQVLS